MAINWADVEAHADADLGAAKDRTDVKLASKISSITSMTDEEVQRLFPEPADAKRLAALMQIVQSSDTQNRKVDQLVSNIQNLAGTVITLLGRLR